MKILGSPCLGDLLATGGFLLGVMEMLSQLRVFQHLIHTGCEVCLHLWAFSRTGSLLWSHYQLQWNLVVIGIFQLIFLMVLFFLSKITRHTTSTHGVQHVVCVLLSSLLFLIGYSRTATGGLLRTLCFICGHDGGGDGRPNNRSSHRVI